MFNTLPYNYFPASTAKFEEGKNDAIQAEIDAIKDGTNIDSFGDVETALSLKVNSADMETALATKTNLSNIAPTFDSESGTYDIGEQVIYEGVLYEFISAHDTPGDWDSTEVQAVKISELIDTLNSNIITFGNVIKSIANGEYTTFYDMLRSFTDGVRYCGFWSINNYIDKPTGATNSANYALFFNASSAYYYGKILLFSAGDVYLGYLATDTATSITWTKLDVAT